MIIQVNKTFKFIKIIKVWTREQRNLIYDMNNSIHLTAGFHNGARTTPNDIVN